MSYDIFVYTSNLSDRVEDVKNPFTGEVTSQPVGESVTDEERLAILGIIDPVKEFGPDEIGAYGVKLSDGSSIELFFDGLDEVGKFCFGMLALDQFAIEIAEFVFQLAEAGHLVIQVGPEGGYVALSDEIADRVGGRWEDVIVIKSAEELFELIQSPFEEWAGFRDRVEDSFDDGGEF